MATLDLDPQDYATASDDALTRETALSRVVSAENAHLQRDAQLGPMSGGFAIQIHKCQGPDESP